MSTTANAASASRARGGFRRLWRVLRQLFHEVVGAVFAVLALGWLNAAFRAWTRDASRWLIALAVSVTNGCPYCINSHTAAVRKLGLDVEALGEVMAVVALFNTTNALADGYQVEPDVLPPQDG